jgi:DNA processing protein
LDRDEIPHLLAALSVAGVGRRAVRRTVADVLQRGGRLADACDTLAGLEGARLPSRNDVATELALIDRLGLSVVGCMDSAFPQLLAAIPDPPLALFCRGDGAALSRPLSVAIVGSRRASAASVRFAQDLAADCAATGIGVVSGLAYGVDAAAHRGALAGRGVTVAVVGGGHSRTYPARHRGLADAIVAAGGAVVGEYAPTTLPRRGHFPERNRIISGLCAGVVVVEATLESGSLITARMGLEQGREVMAVPGSIVGGRHGGCHRLIRDGALLVQSVEEVLEGFGVAAVSRTPPADGLLATVWGAVSTEATTLHELVDSLGLPVQQLLAALTELEIDGFVTACDDGYIRRP